MKKTKIEKGITLIALIITIVVLLILAAVAINAITEYNIIESANSAAQKYGDQVEAEQIQLKLNDWIVEKYSQTGKTFFEYLKEIYGEDNVSDNGDGTYTVVLGNGNEYKVQENGTIISIKGIFIEAQGMPLMLEEGKTVTGILKATIVGIKGEITWSNENDSVATISATSGESITVTAVARGETKIIASCSGYKAEYIVKVSTPIEVGVYVEYDVSYTDMYQGTTYTSENGWRYLGTDDVGNKLLVSTAIPVVLYYSYDIAGENAKWWDTDTTLNANVRATNGILNNFEKIPYTQITSGTTVSTENTAIGRFSGNEMTVKGTTYTAIGDIFKSSTYLNKIEKVRTLTLAELNKAINSATGGSREETSTSSGFKELTGDALGLFDMRDLVDYTAKYYYWVASPVDGGTDYMHLVRFNYTFVTSHYSYAYGVRPVVVLSSDVEIADIDEDGVYEIILD